MARITSTQARQAAAAALLAVLSALPYAIVYGIDRALEVPHAARAALWPTAVVPVLVAALLAVQFVGGRSSQQARLAAVQPLSKREQERAA
jgi:hypothetical protein